MQCPDSGCGEKLCAHGCFRVYESLVRNLVYHIIRSPNEVDDLVQEVFIKAYQSMDSFRGGSFRAYLAQIARNHCYDWLRRKKAKRSITYVELVAETWASTEAGPEESMLKREQASDLLEILEQLGEPDREILILRHVYDLSYEEIGTVVGMNAGAVRTRISRARHKLMEALERREQHEPSQLG